MLEIGLVDKIKLDEDVRNSPNFYYKIKNEGASPDDNINIDNVGKISFAHSINSSIVKQKIIIDLLLYANILLNEKGICTLQTFCENYKDNIDVEDYKHIIALLESFFETINYDEDTITLTNVSSDDITQMMDFERKTLQQLQKKDTHSHAPEETKKISTTNQKENYSNDKQDKKSHANQEITNIVNNYIEFKDTMIEKNIDVEIAYKTYQFLTSSGQGTLQEITNYICEGKDPDEITSSHIAMKIDQDLNRMFVHDYLDFIGNKYVLQESFIDLVETAKGDGS